MKKPMGNASVTSSANISKSKGRMRHGLNNKWQEMLIHVTEELYEDDEDNDPYEVSTFCSHIGDGEVCHYTNIGFTAAAVMQLCRELGVPIHVKWQNCKIESYTPEKSQYEALCIYIFMEITCLRLTTPP